MALHKIVNGKSINLKPEEEADILMRWENVRLKKEKHEKDLLDMRSKKKNLLQSICQKLEISEEELSLVLKKI
jgi:hypothetical protein